MASPVLLNGTVIPESLFVGMNQLTNNLRNHKPKTAFKIESFIKNAFGYFHSNFMTGEDSSKIKELMSTYPPKISR